MRKDVVVYCSWCGDEIRGATYNPTTYQSCGRYRCDKEVDLMDRSDLEQARRDAEADEYARYRR